MHELNATQAMIDRAIQQAEEKHARRITAVHVVIGGISGFSEEAIRFHWSELSKGTMADGARFEFRKIDAELQCMACFTKYQPEGDEIRCPVCGSSGAKILAGEELYMEAIDVE